MQFGHNLSSAHHSFNQSIFIEGNSNNLPKPAMPRTRHRWEWGDCIPYLKITWGAFVWDQSGLRTIGIMGNILIPEYLDFHSGISSGMYSLFRNIPNERALKVRDTVACNYLPTRVTKTCSAGQSKFKLSFDNQTSKFTRQLWNVLAPLHKHFKGGKVNKQRFRVFCVWSLENQNE